MRLAMRLEAGEFMHAPPHGPSESSLSSEPAASVLWLETPPLCLAARPYTLPASKERANGQELCFAFTPQHIVTDQRPGPVLPL